MTGPRDDADGGDEDGTGSERAEPAGGVHPEPHPEEASAADGPDGETGNGASGPALRNGAAGEAGDGEGTADDDAPTLAAILGAEDEELPPRGPLVPERPSPEHVLFVVLGVLLGGYVFWRAAAVFSP